MSKPKALQPDAIIPAAPQPRKPRATTGHAADEKLWEMAKDAATREKEDDGFVSAMRLSDSYPQDADRIVIYAWGPSAQILRDALNINPAEQGCTLNQDSVAKLKTAASRLLKAPE